MARKIYDPNDDNSVDPQLQDQSRELYENFLREEIQIRGLPVPSEIPSLENGISFSNPLWLCNATNLRQLANEFSNFPLRNEVRTRAQQVDLGTLNAQTFGEMIQEVFSGGNMTTIFSSMSTPGALFRAAVAANRPLQVLGTINAYAAVQAEKEGAKALYLSGSGVATASYGIPDLGITDMNDVLTDVRRITRVTKLPLLVDIDTGFGSAFNIRRCVEEMERAGAAAVHIEDQMQAKRCGHRPNKQIVSLDEMVDRIKAAVSGRRDPSFVIMARTDALANEGMAACIARSKAYITAGADMLFPEAFTTLAQYREFCAAIGPSVPVLANITEFGQTPLFNCDELAAQGVSLVLYPLTAFRAMSRAAATVYASVIRERHQAKVVPLMQTRQELYATLEYQKYEDALDAMFAKEQGKPASPKAKL